MIEKNIPAPADPQGFIRSFRLIFVSLGFEIQSNNKNGFSVINRQRMQSNRQNPLMGVSQLNVVLNDDEINILADITNVKRLKKFVYFFPSLLVMGLSVMFGIQSLFGDMPKSHMIWAIPIALVIVFPLVFVPIGKMIEKATITSLDSAIHNSLILSDEKTENG